MRLELEPNPSQIVYPETASVELSAEDRAEEAARHLRDGIKSAQSGDRPAARASLMRAAELDPRSESAWLWLSSISEYPEELLVFLTNVLEINPLNARALEWSVATRSLLAKNFVQRGIDSVESGQSDLAAQHFNQALEYDERNSMAWLWLASLADSNEGKLTYLEKVLEFDPENATAKAELEAARNAIRTGLLAEARAAAVAGKSGEADALLDAIIAEEPDAEDAWILRSHLANDFASKVAAFQRILEINPENTAARSGLESLNMIMDAVTDSERVQQTPEPVLEQPAEEVFGDNAGSLEASATASEAVSTEIIEDHTPLAGSGSEIGVTDDEDQDIYVSPSPFDSLAVENFNEGTMQVETAESTEVCDELSDPGPTSVENVFIGEFIPPHADGVDQQDHSSTASNWWPGSFNGDGISVAEEEDLDGAGEESAQFSEPESIVYELAPEDSEEVFDQEPRQENSGATEGDTIPAPCSDPFGEPRASEEADRFKTIVSIELDDEMRAAVENYEPAKLAFEEPVSRGDAFSVPFDMTMYGGQHIPRPADDLEQALPVHQSSYETRIVNVSPEPTQVSAANACPFCDHKNDMQVISCHGCLAVLTLADLELILANHHADKDALRRSVERMEHEKETRDLSEAELTTLGIGHLNLRNLQTGYQYLHEASQKNPDNVVLSGQVNSLLIRLEEIKQQDAAHEAMTKGKTILVVDDSPTVRKLISGKLEKCGHEVFCSSDGVEAMEALENIMPDLILLDITMPRMDGYQVCKLIRGNESLKDVPVVMISGKDGFFDKVRGRMAGTSGYITKPFGPETLMKAVESYLRADA